jgi:hypothetical protein
MGPIRHYEAYSLSLHNMPEEESLISYSNTGNLVSQRVTSNVAMKQVATDTVFRDTSAVFTGSIKSAQIFIERKSLVDDVYGIKTNKAFVNTLEDNIREREAMDKLISDCEGAES